MLWRDWSSDVCSSDLAADSKRAEAESAANKIALLIANLIDPAAPIGGEADFKVIETIGTPRDLITLKSASPPMGAAGSIKTIDTERGAKVAGARSYYLTGPGALLELALVNYAISSAVKAGFIPMIPPVLVKPAAMEGTGFLGQAAENVYHLKEDELYLVGTFSEA